MITRDHAVDSGSVSFSVGGPAVGGDVVVQVAGETGAPHSLLIGQAGQIADVHGSSSGSASTRKCLVDRWDPVCGLLEEAPVARRLSFAHISCPVMVVQEQIWLALDGCEPGPLQASSEAHAMSAGFVSDAIGHA